MAAQTGRRLKTDSGWSSEGSHDFASSVGERIREARQQKGWTQVELAEAAELSSNYVARLERGELGASLFVASRIAEALDLSLDKLVGPPQSTRTGKRRIGT